MGQQYNEEKNEETTTYNVCCCTVALQEHSARPFRVAVFKCLQRRHFSTEKAHSAAADNGLTLFETMTVTVRIRHSLTCEQDTRFGNFRLFPE